MSACRRCLLRWALVLLVSSLSARAATPLSEPVIRELEARVERNPEDFFALNRLASEYVLAQRRTGDPALLARAARAVESSLQVLGEPANAGAFSAQSVVALARHRFAEALAAAETFRRLKPEALAGRDLRFDALLALHRLEAGAAELGEIRRVAGESLGWHGRMARLARARGDRVAEQKHWDGAVAFARDPGTLLSDEWKSWAYLQRGAAALARGAFDAAEADFSAAQKLGGETWLVLEYLGELRGAQGRWEECLPLLRRAAASSASPASAHALGDALVAAGKPAEAGEWLDRAEAGYLATVRSGEVIYLHHLAAFYSDSRLRPSEALKFAEQDLALRRTPETLDAAAWALYRAERFEEAWKLAREALQAGGDAGGNPHLLSHAAFIAIRAGALAEGRALLKRATELNPAVSAFHIHR